MQEGCDAFIQAYAPLHPRPWMLRRTWRCRCLRTNPSITSLRLWASSWEYRSEIKGGVRDDKSEEQQRDHHCREQKRPTTDAEVVAKAAGETHQRSPGWLLRAPE